MGRATSGSAVVVVLAAVYQTSPATAVDSWTLMWSEEFNGAVNTGVDAHEWLYDIGTQYPGGPAQWGTGEVETMSSSTANVYQDGNGHLLIKPLHAGTSPSAGWTSGRIETQKVFEAPPNGALAIEAAIQQPNVSGAGAAGYWPAFWALGSPFRGNYQNWPDIGEIDIMEDVNGLSAEFATFHCGTAPNGPCNEFTGISSGQRSCTGCQTASHIYRVELDKSVLPQQIRWYLDGVNFFTVNSTQVDATTWANATNHPFFIILDVAIGGGFPGGPTSATLSGIPMLVDYVRVFKRAAPFTDNELIAGVTVIRVVHITELRTRIDAVRGRVGLAAFPWTDPMLAAGTTAVRAVHIIDLRTALSQAYVAAGRMSPTYTDPTLVAGDTVTAAHIAELRAAVIAID
jgi:beta-glucanase (GH16 family)